MVSLSMSLIAVRKFPQVSNEATKVIEKYALCRDTPIRQKPSFYQKWQVLST